MSEHTETGTSEWYGPATIDRDRHGQRDSSSTTGDCFRACMSVLLQVPNGDHLPHGIDTPDWWTDWWRFLLDLGLTIAHDNAQGPIWKEQPWIASVPSLNHEGCTHAIVMHRAHEVLFDPSPHKRYEGSLLGEGVVLGGTWLEVADVRAFPWLMVFRADHNGHAETPSDGSDSGSSRGDVPESVPNRKHSRTQEDAS